MISLIAAIVSFIGLLIGINMRSLFFICLNGGFMIINLALFFKHAGV